MPIRYIQKGTGTAGTNTTTNLGCNPADPQPGNVASIGWNKTTGLLEVNGDGVTRFAFSNAEPTVLQLLAGTITQPFFVADKPYQVVSVQEVHSVVSTSGTLALEKDTGTQAPGGGVNVLGVATISLSTTINTVQSPALTATAANSVLATGDRLTVIIAGTMTGLVGTLNVVLRPI